VPTLFLLKFSLGEHADFALPAWWGLLDYGFLLISFVAVFHAAGHTTSKQIRIALWIFWSALTVAIVFEAMLHWVAYIASAGLIGTHFVNLRRMKKQYQDNLIKI
jgi:hypothetical protein